MATKKAVTIDNLPLVGGSPCLDLVNTIGHRASDPRERLHSFRDLAVLCRRVGLIDAEQERQSRQFQELNPAAAREVLDGVIELRESLWEVGRAIAASRSAGPPSLRLLNRVVRQGARHKRLALDSDSDSGGPRWEWSMGADLSQARYRFADSAAELFTSPKVQRLRQCGACDWLFLDLTKNRSRIWCHKTCGDRVKSRRYYRRHRG